MYLDPGIAAGAALTTPGFMAEVTDDTERVQKSALNCADDFQFWPGVFFWVGLALHATASYQDPTQMDAD